MNRSRSKSTKELIDYAKANPNKLTIANSGVGGATHITAVAMAKQLGIQWKNIPYKGGAAASRAVVSGESGVIINGAAATMPFVVNKQLVGLAVTGEQRDCLGSRSADLQGGRPARRRCRDLAGHPDHGRNAAGHGRAVERRDPQDPGRCPRFKQKIAEQGGVVKRPIAGGVPRPGSRMPRPAGARSSARPASRAAEGGPMTRSRIDLQDLLFGLFPGGGGGGSRWSPRAIWRSATAADMGPGYMPRVVAHRADGLRSLLQRARALAHARRASRPFSCGRCLRSWLLSASSR